MCIALEHTDFEIVVRSPKSIQAALKITSNINPEEARVSLTSEEGKNVAAY